MSRNKKYWKRRFGNLDGNTEPYYDHLDLRRVDDLDDEGLAYLLRGVKGVNMLDLDETEITNESIKLLTSLEYVKELRAKGCKLDDGCIADLNKIASLEFLHLKNTSVTIDGLLKLHALTKLHTLMFSADDVEAIKEKMWELKSRLPGCAFVINSKPYYFDAIDRFISVVKAEPYTYRLKIKNDPLSGEWSDWLNHPSDNYYEAEKQGPWSINDIEWIDINPIENRKEGRLVPEKEFDHSEKILKLLEDLSITCMVFEGFIRVYIVKNEL